MHDKPVKSFGTMRQNGPLFLGHHGAQKIRHLVTRDQFATDVSEQVLQRAAEIRNLPPISPIFEADRPVLLPTSRELIDRVLHLGLAAILTGSNQYTSRAIDELLAVAQFDDWNPSHFLDTAEMATGVAIGLSWYSPLMSGKEQGILVDALINKAALNAISQFQSGVFWTGAEHNWNVVCCGAMIITALIVAKSEPEISEKLLELATQGIVHGLKAFGEDGDYVEGPAYWEYALRYAALTFAAMQQFGMEADIPPGVTNSWRYCLDIITGSGECFNYADNPPILERSPVLGWIALQQNHPDAGLAQRTMPGRLHPFDLIWLSSPPEKQTIDGSSVPGKIVDYCLTGATVQRGKLDGKDFYLGIKHGRNDVNHAHLDLGSFVLELEDQRFVCDLGRDDYALPGYFDKSQRFKYLRTNTFGHGTLVLNGRNQSICAHGDLVDTGMRLKESSTTIAINDPDASLDHARKFLVENSGIWIIDKLRRKNGYNETSDFIWQIYTRGTVSYKADLATVIIGKYAMHFKICPQSGFHWEIGDVAKEKRGFCNSSFTRLFFSGKVSAATSQLCVLCTPAIGHAENPTDPPVFDFP